MTHTFRLLCLICGLGLSLGACSAPPKKKDAIKPQVVEPKKEDAELKNLLKKAPYANPRWENPPPGMQNGEQED